MKRLSLKFKKKKGASILEFIGVLPFFVFMAWMSLQTMFYTESHITLQEAVKEGARAVAMDLRNYAGDSLPSNATTKSQLINDLEVRMDRVSQFNGLLMLFHDQSGHIPYSNITVSYDNKAECKTLDSQLHKTFICLNLVTDDTRTPYTGEFKRKEIRVYAKAKFLLYGSLIPSLVDNMYIHSTGVATIDGDSRYNYYPQ